MRRIAVDDLVLAVRDEGRGVPVLFAHGFPLDHRMWEGQLAPLSADRRLLVPDLRGFGESDGSGPVVPMHRYADDLAELLDRLEVTEPVHFVGLSMGGYVAFEFARRHRRRLRSLVLCDTRAGTDTDEGRQGRLKLAERVLTEGTGFVAETLVPRLFAQKTLAERARVVDLVRSEIAAASPEGTAAASLGMAERADSTALLPTLDLPVLVLVGSEDQISPADEMRRMAAAIPGAEFHALPDAGHMAPLEDPAATNAHLAAFFERVEG